MGKKVIFHVPGWGTPFDVTSALERKFPAMADVEYDGEVCKEKIQYFTLKSCLKLNQFLVENKLI